MCSKDNTYEKNDGNRYFEECSARRLQKEKKKGMAQIRVKYEREDKDCKKKQPQYNEKKSIRLLYDYDIMASFLQGTKNNSHIEKCRDGKFKKGRKSIKA